MAVLSWNCSGWPGPTWMDLGTLKETKITGGVYAQESVGFFVFALDMPSRHCRGLALFYKELLRFAVEAHHHHVPKVVSFQLATGGRQWYVVGCYLAPNDASDLERFIVGIGQQPWGVELLASRDFNVYLTTTNGYEHEKEIPVVMVMEGLEDIKAHLLTKHSPWTRDARTRRMICLIQKVRSQTDFILRKDHGLL